MRCKTIKGYGVKKDGSKGEPIYGPKIKFETLEDAQVEADRQNALPMVFIKREAYKCKKCKKYHVGKTYDMIEGKVAKPKVDKFRSLNLRVVGKIDLGVVPDKKWNPILKEKEKAKRALNVPVKGISQKKKSNGNEPYGDLPMPNGMWKFHFKKKIVIITRPDGGIRKPSLNKIYDERALKLYGDGHCLSKRTMRQFIKDNFYKLK